MNAKHLAEAQAYHAQAMKRVQNTSEPKGQKFPCGSRVRIADDLGPYMKHFPKGRQATVVHTYAHAYGGNDVKQYQLDVDGCGEVAWYNEHQLIVVR
jgi:hypothetical protein